MSIRMAVALCLALLSLLSLATSVSASATVVYVNGATGSDSNKGTSASPFQTLNHTVSVLCENVNPEYVVVVAAIPPPFVYVEGVTFPTGCEALSVTFTPIDPSSDSMAVEEKEDVPMPAVAWITKAGAVNSLTFDHISFKDVPFLYITMMPSLDLGPTASYTLTVQNCLFEGLKNGSSIILGARRSSLQSGIVLNFINNIVQNNRLNDDFIYTQGLTSINLNLVGSTFKNNSVTASFARIVNANTANIAVVDKCDFYNNSFIDLLFYILAPAAGGSQPMVSAFNFTNNDISYNSIGGVLDVTGENGPTIVMGNRIEYNTMQVSSASAYYGSLSQPIVISNNIYTCNVKFSDYLPPMFEGPALPLQNWVLSGNVNGDPINCAIVPGSGMYMADAINAIPCAAGTWNPGAPGDATCYPCAAGTYANEPGSSGCTYCPQGSFAGTTGAVQCTLCPIGTHANTQGATGCADCNSGQYASQTGEIVCQMCATGTCTPSTGAWSSCEAAPCSNSSSIISLE